MSDPLVWTLDDGAAAGRWEETSGGGSQTVRTAKFSFAYNTASLAAGIKVDTLAAGEWLANAKMRVTTAWNGTTPTGDIGWAGYTSGLFKDLVQTACDMTAADYDWASDGKAFANNASYNLSAGSILNNAAQSYPWSNSLPFLFAQATDLTVFVTQDGFPGGAAPGGSAGTAQVVLEIWTPA